jgi:uncharacterized protein (DUF362 family)
LPEHRIQCKSYTANKVKGSNNLKGTIMADKEFDRRRFLKLTGKAAIIASAVGAGGYFLSKNKYSPSTDSNVDYIGDRSVEANAEFPDLAAVKSTDHKNGLLKAVAMVGGIERFISQGDIVTLKPNIGWDRTPEQAANTNPELVREIAIQCFEAGATKVVVTDVPCNDARRTYKRSGIEAALKDTGAEIVFPEDRFYVKADLKGEILGRWEVLRQFLETDKIINMPIVKHHSLSKMTVGMKNWYGVLGGPRNRLHQKIDLSITDLADFFRPTLVIVDATRVLFRNGPVGGSLSDVEVHDTVIAATDQVAADSYACRFLNLDPESIEFLKDAETRGIGQISDYNKIEETI